MQNRLKDHYDQAAAIVAERQAEMNSNLARIATDKALRDANDLIQKQRKDILDYQAAMTRMDTIENALGTLMDSLENTMGIGAVLDLEPARQVLSAGREVSFDNQ